MQYKTDSTPLNLYNQDLISLKRRRETLINEVMELDRLIEEKEHQPHIPYMFIQQNIKVEPMDYNHQLEGTVKHQHKRPLKKAKTERLHDEENEVTKEEEEIKVTIPMKTTLDITEEEKVAIQWNCLKDEIKQLKTTSLDKHTIANLQARYDLANKKSMLDAPRLTKELRCSVSEKSKKYKRVPNRYVCDPITTSHQRAKGAFRMNVLPGPKGAEDEMLALSQYGSVAGVPFTNYPINGQYIFTRNPDYHDRTLRKKYLERYYLPLVSNNSAKDNRNGAKAVISLFSHFIKETLVTGVNKTALIAMIEYELRKAGMPVMSKHFVKAFRVQYMELVNLFDSKPIIVSQFKLNSERKVPQMPTDTQEKEEKESVNIMKVRKKFNTPLNEPIIAADWLIIDKDTDVYDENTGELIVSLRKKVVSESTIEGINKYAFNTTIAQLQEYGARSKSSDKVETQAKNKSKKVPRSAPFGILGLKQQNVSLTSFTSGYQYNIATITHLGNAIRELEAVYKVVCPQEYHYCEKAMEPLQEYMIFPDAKITCAVELNYDKQTFTHQDKNKFPGKTFGFMSCFYGSKQRRYTGGNTIFPEYGIGFNVEQGDCLIANFEELVHANTPIIPLDKKEFFTITNEKYKSTTNIPNWHRVSLVGYTRGSLVEKVERFSYEDSDDEAEHDFSAQQISDEIIEPSLPQKKHNPFLFFMQEAVAKPPRQVYLQRGKDDEPNAQKLYEERNVNLTME